MTGDEFAMTDSANMDLDVLWQRAIDSLPAGSRAWLTNAQAIALHGNTLIVAVPNDFTRTQLETRVRDQVEAALSTVLGHDIRIGVTVDSHLDPGPMRHESSQVDLSTSRHDDEDDEIDTFVPSWTESPVVREVNPGSLAGARLNPRYTFDRFVIGASNRFTHAAAVAVAEDPGKAYNPLLIWGDSGLGKTHLLHAIGHYVLSVYPDRRVRYVNTEEFTNDVINAIQQNKQPQLRARYRDVDLLLVDDIQFIQGKEQTQNEFFYTFEALHNANKQIVITSDRPPTELQTLDERLSSRFKWGLQADVQPPDLETRIAILRKKAAAEGLSVPADVMEFIASKIQTNIRELEGALIRATAFASLNQQTVDLPLAQIVLKDLIPEGGEPDITAALIMAQTSAYSEFSIDELCGANRSRDLVLARQMAMYLCRELTELSLPKIGQKFGGRDHTTVMHADKKIRKLMAERRQVYEQISELTNRIKHHARQV